MGTDFDCGCRRSMGHWFLCEKHTKLVEEGVELREKSVCKHHCPCYFERGECCNCKAILLHEQDEFEQAENEREEQKLMEVAQKDRGKFTIFGK
ncbi:MAG: hypothetical protein PVI03_02030 [Candidatus Thorarchaeota archaeon]